MADLREVVAWALFEANPLRWENYRVASLAQLPQQERQTLLNEADAALEAIKDEGLVITDRRNVR